jgi:dTDP-4-dehydrorhamnose 3,5-epimerase
MRAVLLEESDIPDVKIITAKKVIDGRGFFCETYSRRAFREAGYDIEFVQDNHSLSTNAGTVRGIHFQSPPFAQDKLIRVARGAILDVAVDLRWSSPSYGHHVAVEISAINWLQIFVPAGFAHGFCTLERDTEVQYKVSRPYMAEYEFGLAWDDPALRIAWPVNRSEAILSQRDRMHPKLAELPLFFP